MPHLEPGVGDMWVFEGQKLSAERTLAVVDGLVDLQEITTFLLNYTLLDRTLYWT